MEATKPNCIKIVAGQRGGEIGRRFSTGRQGGSGSIQEYSKRFPREGPEEGIKECAPGEGGAEGEGERADNGWTILRLRFLAGGRGRRGGILQRQQIRKGKVFTEVSKKGRQKRRISESHTTYTSEGRRGLEANTTCSIGSRKRKEKGGGWRKGGVGNTE